MSDFNDYIDLMPNLPETVPNDGASYSALPVGDYEFEIESVNMGQTKGSEEKPPCPQLIVEFKVVSEEQNGKTTRGWYKLDNTSDFCRGRLMALLSAAGVTPDTRGGFSASGLVGKTIIATISHEDRPVTNNDGTSTSKTYTRLNKERPVAAPVVKAAPAAAGASVRKTGPAANGGPAARR